MEKPEGQLLCAGNKGLAAMVQCSEVLLKAARGAGGATIPGPARKGR